MGVASLSPAFPSIMEYFNLDKKEVGLLITFFTVPGIFFTPLTGVLADRYGRKAILIPSLFLFGLAGLACVFAQTFNQLLFLRVLQGLGATSLGSINITLIGDLYQGNSRTKMMGVNASVLSVGTALYPIIGGLLAAIKWQMVFILPAFGVLVGFIVLLFLKNPEPTKKVKLKDYFSNVWENINQRSVWALFIIGILIFFVLYGTLLTFVPVLLKEEFNLLTQEIGYTLSIMSITTALISSQLSKISKFLDSRKRLMAGGLAYALAMLLIGLTNSFDFIIVAMIIFGIGHGILIPSLQTTLVAYASLSERAAFMSINSMVLRLGQSFGPIVIGAFLVFNNFKAVFFAGAGFAFLIAVISIFWIKGLKQ